MRSQDYPPKRWTDDEVEQVRKLRAAGMGYSDIGRKLGRNVSSVWVKLEKRPVRKLSGDPHATQVPESVIAERERRSYLSRPTLTSQISGDPLPGYSALDQREITRQTQIAREIIDEKRSVLLALKDF